MSGEMKLIEKATARPWTIVRSCKMPTVNGSDGKCVFSMGSAYFRGIPACEANAELIVTAVNSHATLVNTLEEAKARRSELEKVLDRADLLLSKIKTQKHHPNYELYLEGECVSIASLGTSFADLFWSFHKRVMTVREEIRALRSVPVQTALPEGEWK